MNCIVQLNSGYWNSVEFLMTTPLNTLPPGFIKEAKLSYPNPQAMVYVYLSQLKRYSM